ncbi:MAG TPA: bifunctional serine/threonine-protein kinase/formylglycine-generating enzyme family protein [Steroidobacteraceae bacterium]|nr:bifunctional serine/threonine-protein kinase/formylglycine-generating enzyme family protein [Steroidobacteraceae bacterium]
MSVADADALGQKDLDATRIPLRPAKTPSIAAGGDPWSTVDPDATNWQRPVPLEGSPGGASDACKPDAVPEPGIGRVLGNRYRLEQLLGAGGMGDVYRASDLQVPGEVFAIKVLKPMLRGHRELLGALRDELRRTRPLSHPNIVGAYSINSDQDGDYMLMEYLEGETLHRLLDREFGRGIPFPRAWPFIMDICAALAYAHDHNVIHSDLKPSNVFVTTGGKAKLLDFGIARVARGPIRGFDACAAATESYASCEMLEGGSPDACDDVYALGCVVYEMLSGRHPFGRRSATNARDLKLLPAPLASLTRRQNAALAKALCFDRDRRTASVEAFESQLQPASVPSWARIALGGLAVIAIAAVILLVGRTVFDRAAGPGGAASPAHVSTLAQDQLLARQAAAVKVDPDDSHMKAGLRALADAQAKIRAGAQGEAQAYLDKAEGSLSDAIRLSPRIAIVGNTAAETEMALQLCRREISDSSDCTSAALSDESVRTVSLRPFALDQAPVTNAEFARFVGETGYVTAAERSNGLYAAAEKPVFLPGWSWKTLRDKELPHDFVAGDFPVRGIDYATAKAYCAWSGKRLPSEDEWEFAARGPSRKLFPWGDRAEDAPDPRTTRLWPAAKLPGTGFSGGRGLGGVLWEWTNGATDAKPILRGPSYLVNVAFFQRLATRNQENPTRARVDIGLRCATGAETWPDAHGGSSPAPGG